MIFYNLEGYIRGTKASLKRDGSFFTDQPPDMLQSSFGSPLSFNGTDIRMCRSHRGVCLVFTIVWGRCSVSSDIHMNAKVKDFAAQGEQRYSLQLLIGVNVMADPCIYAIYSLYIVYKTYN